MSQRPIDRRQFLVVPAAAALVAAGCKEDRAGVGQSAVVRDGWENSGDRLVRGDWPALFGPQRTAVANDTQLIDSFSATGPTRLWSRPLGTGYSSPIISSGRLVLHHRVDDQEIVEAVDAASGQPLWSRRFPTTFECRYEYSSGPYATPLADEDRVVTISAEAVMRSHDLASGSLLWERDLRREYRVPDNLFAFGATPLRHRDMLIVNAGGREADSGVVAVDWGSGETRWTATDHGASYATPVSATIGGRSFLFIATDEGLVALRPSDGSLHWSIPFRPRAPDSVNATSPTVIEDHVLMVTGPGPGAVCVRVDQDGAYQEVWRDRRILDSQFNTLITLGDYVYGYTSRQQGGAKFRCLEARTGRLCWSLQSKLKRGTGLAADGKLFLLGEHGHLYLVNASPLEKNVLASTAEPLLTRPCYSSPALAAGRLYLRNETQIICLDVSAG